MFQLTGNGRGAFRRGDLQDSLHDDDNGWHPSLHLAEQAPADLATKYQVGNNSPHQLGAAAADVNSSNRIEVDGVPVGGHCGLSRSVKNCFNVVHVLDTPRYRVYSAECALGHGWLEGRDGVPPWRRGAGAQWGRWSIGPDHRYPIGGRIQQE